MPSLSKPRRSSQSRPAISSSMAMPTPPTLALTPSTMPNQSPRRLPSKVQIASSATPDMVMAQALPQTDCSGWAAMTSPASTIELAERLADQVFLHLAHGVARQLFDKEYPLGVFELGEFVDKGVQHIAFCQGSALRGHNAGSHAFAKVAMRQADHRRLDHTR